MRDLISKNIDYKDLDYISESICSYSYNCKKWKVEGIHDIKLYENNGDCISIDNSYFHLESNILYFRHFPKNNSIKTFKYLKIVFKSTFLSRNKKIDSIINL